MDIILGMVVMVSSIGIGIACVGIALMLHELADAIREMRLLLKQREVNP